MQWEHAAAIASQIYNANADYVLALIANHPTLHEQVETWFKQAQTQGFVGIEFSHDEQVEKGHQRKRKASNMVCSSFSTTTPTQQRRLGRTQICCHGGAVSPALQAGFPP